MESGKCLRSAYVPENIWRLRDPGTRAARLALGLGDRALYFKTCFFALLQFLYDMSRCEFLFIFSAWALLVFLNLWIDIFYQLWISFLAFLSQTLPLPLSLCFFLL